MKKGWCGELRFLEELGVFSIPLRRDWVGPGDDAAVVPPLEGSIAFSADLLVDNVHFRRSTHTPEDVGYKALAVNVSDMAAMGARPVAACVTLTVPDGVGVDWFKGVYRGIAEASRELGCPVVGGDLSRGFEISLSVSIIGDCARRGPLLRSGAKPGHILWLTGTTGESAAGLALLEKGVPIDSESLERLVARHRRPAPRHAFGREIARRGLASAMIDVSDGLVKDAHNIACLSNVRLVVDSRLVPLSNKLAEAARILSLDPQKFALGGGEDYELLFTAPEELKGDILDVSKETGLAVTEIGSAEAGEGVAVLGDKGEFLSDIFPGFDHFSGV